MAERKMASKTIMVHVTDDQRLEGMLDVIGPLAVRLRAHVIGLVASSLALPNLPEKTADREDHLRNRLQRSAQDYGYSTEWRSIGGKGSARLALAAAHTADVVIASQIDVSSKDRGANEIIELYLIGAGRPVILAPSKSTSTFHSERILIGWNGTQACTRAVADAIPILKAASWLKILHLKKPGENPRSLKVSVERLVASLARHAIYAEAEEIELPISDPGTAILSAAKADNADLLVIGCDGYIRFHDFVPGSTTRRVLKQMNIPVLMSH